MVLQAFPQMLSGAETFCYDLYRSLSGVEANDNRSLWNLIFEIGVLLFGFFLIGSCDL